MCTRKGGATPLDLATDTGGACYSVLQSHTAEFIAIRKKPAAFVSMAVSHCASLNLPAGAPISKRAYLLNPPFLWAPSFARVLLFKWARGAAIIHIAGDTAPFASLPDDCAGDVLEYLEVAMTRTESLHVTEHCSSPKARDWVRAVLAAAVAVSTSLVQREMKYIRNALLRYNFDKFRIPLIYVVFSDFRCTGVPFSLCMCS